MRSKLKSLNISVPLGTYMGIPLKLHASMVLLLLFIFAMGIKQHFNFAEYVAVTLLFTILFVCVTLHEYGHAYMASTFGIKTHDIVLSPIGGVARLDNIPKDSKKELLIAIAGPLVNLAIFIGMIIPFGVLIYAGVIDFNQLSDDISKWKNFLFVVAISNLGLFLFNLIPAFPMDGGRILRSLLSMKTDHLTATKIASRIGKLLAVTGVIVGLWFGQPIWVMIGVFIFFMADMELNFLKKELEMESILAKQLITRPVAFVSLHTPMNDLIEQHFEIDEKDIVVKNGFGKIAGLVTITSLQEAMRTNANDALVQSFVTQRYGIVNENDHIITIMSTMKNNDFKEVLVMNFGEVMGVIRVEDINNRLIPNNQKPKSPNQKLIDKLRGAEV